ncbi:hypothetical protein SynMVIR181_00391 [Synechococcus sp. MVIR-18-1]|nr:hypothetical protein SynMVIR181_00391 [Synechococcus sp. MVIR-18-1]
MRQSGHSSCDDMSSGVAWWCCLRLMTMGSAGAYPWTNVLL